MPLAWFSLSGEERGQAILDDIEGITDEEAQNLIAEWKSIEDIDIEDDSSCALLAQMAQDVVLRKKGLPTTKERAINRLRRRGVIE